MKSFFKPEHTNVIQLDDYLDNRSGRVRRPIKGFDKQIVDAKIPLSDELSLLNKEIAEYEAEAEKTAKELKAKLFSAGDNNGKD